MYPVQELIERRIKPDCLSLCFSTVGFFHLLAPRATLLSARRATLLRAPSNRSRFQLEIQISFAVSKVSDCPHKPNEGGRGI